jgi:hypothetical protein
MMAHSRAAAVLPLVLLLACTTPTQPISDFGNGVTLYPDSLFRGDHVTVDGSVSNLLELRGPCAKSDDDPSGFDDCISSIRIPAGWLVTVYRDRDFGGDSATYTADVRDLDLVAGPCKPGFNDCISSIKVFRQ